MILRIVTVLLLLFVIEIGYSQRPAADTLNQGKDQLIIQPILHGTLMLKYKKQTILIDPYGGEAALADLESPTLILITDIHGDHLNEESLLSIETEQAKIIAPQAVKDKMASQFKKQTEVIANHEEMKVNGILIEAIPMYNLPESPDSRHVKGRGNGYVLNLGQLRVYISGDTADIVEMRQLENIDLAFVCMNLPYTMDIHQAASAVLDFKPRIVYPFHYRGKPGKSDTQAFKDLVIDQNSNVEVRLRNWYPQY